jgi:DNA-binding transcriptional LysR family regulator
MQQIDLRRIDLNLLVVFDALMAERSVTRAAARLARTQPAISHALARLREQVGDPLLVKVGGRMEPTPRALALAGEVQAALHGIRRMLAPPVPFDPSTSTRTFRVAFPDLTSAWFAQLAASIRDTAPGVCVEWLSRDAFTPLAVAAGSVDVALYPAALTLPEGVTAEHAGTFSWATFARRGNPAIRHWGRAAWRRAAHAAVRVGEHMPNPVTEAVPAARERRIVAWVPHFSAVAPLLARTDLIATLPMVAMADAMERYDLIALRPPFALQPMAHRQIASRRLAAEPGLAWFATRVRETFAATLADAETRVVKRMGLS